MSRKVTCLGLPVKLVNLLEKEKIYSCKDVLDRNSLELMMEIRVSFQEAQSIIQIASLASSPKPTNVFSLYEESCSQKIFLETSLSKLDILMHGGLSRKNITEISGPPGCGKTQFCLMICIIQLLREPLSSAVYIDTEGAFDVKRFLEMAINRFPEEVNCQQKCDDLALRLLLFREKKLQSLKERLENLEEVIINNKIGLVVLDSVVSLMKSEFDIKLKKGVFERNKELSKQTLLLKKYASNYNLIVVVTNQITIQFVEENRNSTLNSPHPSSFSPSSSSLSGLHHVTLDPIKTEEEEEENEISFKSNKTTVALGLQWSHSINCRITLQYLPKSTFKQLILAKSANCPYAKFNYIIDKSGIRFIDDNVEFGDEDFYSKSLSCM